MSLRENVTQRDYRERLVRAEPSAMCAGRFRLRVTTKLCTHLPRRARFLLDPVAHAGPERQGHNATGDRRGLAPFGQRTHKIM